jgi:hypothetical protein
MAPWRESIRGENRSVERRSPWREGLRGENLQREKSAVEKASPKRREELQSAHLGHLYREEFLR